jgi:hypothetical protein
MPALSVIPTWFAEFGLLIILPVIFFVVRSKLDFTISIVRMKEANVPMETQRLYHVVNDMFFFTFIYFIPVGFLLFDWTSLSYVFLFGFFIVVKDYLSARIDSIAPLQEKDD